MRCPVCGCLDDRVVDSRATEDGCSIRRRRQCESCGRRFTTFERIEEAVLVVVKRSGSREPFTRAKVVEGVASAAKGRPVSAEQVEALVQSVEDALVGPEVRSEDIGRFVLERLRHLDEVAYLRFASVYKSFDAAEDFKRELHLLSDQPESSTPGP